MTRSARSIGQFRGNDPDSVAQAVLENHADILSSFMAPKVDMLPTGSLEINGSQWTTLQAVAAIPMIWPCNGYVVAIAASVRSAAAADLAGTLLRVDMDGSTSLFTTGQAQGYKPFSRFSTNPWQTRVSFRQNANWSAYINNTTTGTIVADVSFDFVNTSLPRP